jgi:hypothetical protein
MERRVKICIILLRVVIITVTWLTTDGVWIGIWIYCTLTHTTRNY